MNIDCLGESVISQLVTRSLVGDLSDLYSLTKDQLLLLDGFADKSAENLITSIQLSKKQDLWRFICGLGIKNVGKSASKDLARKFGSIKALMNSSIDDLIEIDGVGMVMANSVNLFFQEESNKLMISKLYEYGLNLKMNSSGSEGKEPFRNKTFVVTGTLSQFTREQVVLAVEEFGGKVSSSVSKKTDYLIAGSSAGSKLEKAEKLEVPIVNEEDFLTMLSNAELD